MILNSSLYPDSSEPNLKENRHHTICQNLKSSSRSWNEKRLSYYIIGTADDLISNLSKGAGDQFQSQRYKWNNNQYQREREWNKNSDFQKQKYYNNVLHL